MKKIAFILVGLSILYFSKPGLSNGEKDNQKVDQSKIKSQNTITVMCPGDLQNIAENWAKAYETRNPSAFIAFSTFDERKFVSENVLSILSDKEAAKISSETAWKMIVAKDVVVPVFNRRNPLFEEISKQGITSSELALIFTEEYKPAWNLLINEGQNTPINFYIMNNEVVKNGISDFVKLNPTLTNAVLLNNACDLIAAIEKDIHSIGFCRLADITDSKANQWVGEVAILPIDKNKNGRIDNFENIYQNLASFTRGVWIGKYPSALTGNIYAVSILKPVGEEQVAFLSWLTSEGQQTMNESGLCAISTIEKENNLLALAPTEINAIPEEGTSLAGLWVLIIAVVFVAGFFVTAIVRSFRKAAGAIDTNMPEIKPALDENSIAAPKGIYFDRSHTWAFMEKDGNVRVGIDDFLQHITGVLTRIKMKTVGEKIRRGEKILTINQNGKQLEICSPVSGTIREQNHALESDSTIINSAPYTDGWVYSIEPINWLREIQLMFMSDKYKEWLRNEFSRLRDFFAASVRSNDAVYAQIVLQDGGELADNVLADLGPEVWEEFQEKFINSSK